MRALAESGLKISWEALTVGQNVLQRVDAVEDNETCRGDWLEGVFPGRRSQSENKVLNRHSIRNRII